MTKRIAELGRQRRARLRQAKRARERRRANLRKARRILLRLGDPLLTRAERTKLRQQRRRALARARSARRTAQRNNHAATANLRDIRTLRKARSEANRLARIVRHQRKVWGKSGVSWYDGRQVATWLVPYLAWARANGWRGRLVSGWRDPVYSERLCYSMCGRPACPGRCAGRGSNHAGSVKPRGAVDVTDYGTFAALMRRCPYTPRIYNALGARDPVHFSASGR